MQDGGHRPRDEKQVDQRNDARGNGIRDRSFHAFRWAVNEQINFREERHSITSVDTGADDPHSIEHIADKKILPDRYFQSVMRHFCGRIYYGLAANGERDLR